MIFYANEADFSSAYEVISDNASLRTAGPIAAPAAICGSVTLQTTGGGYPKIFTVDYGTGCTDNSGVTRSGMLTVTLTGALFQNGSQMIISRNNYFIDGYKVEGTVTHTNNSPTFFNPQWEISIPDGQITDPEGSVFTHHGTRTLRQTGGFDSEVLLDNVFQITTGTHTVTDEDGSSVVAVITSPMVKNYNCDFISKGSMNLQGSWLDGDLDFGTGACDDDALYTHEPTGETYPVDLNH